MIGAYRFYELFMLAHSVDAPDIVDITCIRSADDHGCICLLIPTHQYVAAIVAEGLGLMQHVCGLFYGL